MDSWGPYGAPAAPAGGGQPPGTTGAVKAAVALTMLAVLLALGEALFAVHLMRDIATESRDDPDFENLRLAFGTLLGANLLIAAGLGGGAILALRRSVAGKVLIWISGALSILLRCGCGGLAGLFFGLYVSGEEENDSPLSTGLWGVLLFIEVVALLAILAAMIMLMTRGASFQDPVGSGRPPIDPGGMPGGYPGPYGPGSPAGPPPVSPPPIGAPGPSAPHGGDGLPKLPPTPGWPG